MYWLDAEKLDKDCKDRSHETSQRKFTLIYYWELAGNRAFICNMIA
jgi:hypothetical protein